MNPPGSGPRNWRSRARRGGNGLAIVRSDAAGQSSQTLAILCRDAVVFVALEGGVDNVRTLRGHTVGLLDGRPLNAKLLDLILQHYAVPPDTVRRRLLTLDQVPEAAQRREVDALFVVAHRCFDPLAVGVDEVDVGHRSVAGLRGHVGDVVELRL